MKFAIAGMFANPQLRGREVFNIASHCYIRGFIEALALANCQGKHGDKARGLVGMARTIDIIFREGKIE